MGSREELTAGEQFAPLRLVVPAAIQPVAHDVQFHFTHDSLQAEQESVVGVIAVVNAIRIGDDRAEESGEFITVTTPPNLREEIIRPKEQALIDLVRSEKSAGRKTWVYVQFTDKHDVQGRLQKLLQQAGFRVEVLRSSVPLARREEWIAQHAPQLDVVIGHPRLVETGLDLFDKQGKHNFPTICFYETGYNLFTLRQAARRSWRIGQKKTCRIVYFHYQATMQERAMALMGKKLTAAQALEGSFSSEGLVAMAGGDASVEIALARSLVGHLDEGDTRRLWNKTVNPRDRHADGLFQPAFVQEAAAVVSEESNDRQRWLDVFGPEILLPQKPRRRSSKRGF